MSRGAEGSTPCYHPLCADVASRWHRVPGVREARGACLAHHLEHRYQEGKRRMREANAARNAARKGKRVTYAGKPLQPCGTPAAAKRHREAGEPVCQPCRVADNARTAAWRATRDARRREALTRAA